ncbi:hypothetical protein V5E97_08745 [Singulisphaera sp. Ch08]|uniref:EmrB/QacA family drug resistance transporter n=1 Tax=Singulisphaera sp. Ch08 TaxID=3120278 RepID=A0AAU7CME3_9BACT
MRQSFVPNRPPLADVRLGLVDYFTLRGLAASEASAQASRLLTRFTHDYAKVFANQSAFQILALVLSSAVVLAICLKPLPPQATGPRRG